MTKSLMNLLPDLKRLWSKRKTRPCGCVIATKCNKTAALLFVQDNCVSQTLKRSWTETEFYVLVPSADIVYANRPRILSV